MLNLEKLPEFGEKNLIIFDEVHVIFNVCSMFISFILNRFSKSPSGFAFIDYETVDEAEKAVEMLNQKKILDSDALEVEIVRRQQNEN